MEAEKQPIRVNALIEIVGKPREYIEEKNREYLAEMKKDENLIILTDKVYEAKEQGKVWSIVSEVELVIKGVESLVGFCIDYMPSSIDIIKPESFNFEMRTFTNFINDMIAKLHRVDMIAKTVGGENRFLKKNMNNMIRNCIIILVRFGVSSLEKLSKATAIEEEELKRFIAQLIEEKIIKEENGLYQLV